MTDSHPRFKPFYHEDLAQALENCQEKHTAIYMPELAEARVQGLVLWNTGYSTPSIRATGRTKQGSAVVVYAHIPNWLANPANIRTAKEQGLVNGAGRFPQDEFQRLVDAEDKQKVWVVDYADLKRTASGRIKITDAIKHPQTIPFLGGQERAERYLSKHAKAYNTKTIGVWHVDDLTDESPLARLLYLGDYGLNGLGGDYLSDYGQFVGVRHASAEGTARIFSLEDTLESIAQKYIQELEKLKIKKK